MHFTPSQIAKLFRTDPATVKRWIYRGLLESDKTPGGHHRVSEEQFKKFVSKYKNENSGSYVMKRLKSNIGGQNNVSLMTYYNLLRNYKWNESMEVLISLYASGLRISQVLDGFVAPVLRKIGDDWLQGKISIYEEHKISFMIDRNLFEMGNFISSRNRIANKNNALLFCAPGDEHVIPLEMLNLVLLENGWGSNILGKNLPIKELEKAITDFKPRIVCITKTGNQKIKKTFYSEIKKILKKYNVEIILGGSGWIFKDLKSHEIPHLNSLYDFDILLQNMIKKI